MMAGYAGDPFSARTQNTPAYVPTYMLVARSARTLGQFYRTCQGFHNVTRYGSIPARIEMAWGAHSELG